MDADWPQAKSSAFSPFSSRLFARERERERESPKQKQDAQLKLNFRYYQIIFTIIMSHAIFGTYSGVFRSINDTIFSRRKVS